MSLQKAAFPALAIVMTACTTLPQGATPYTPTEIETTLTNKTWLWQSGGGIYFKPGGQAIVSHEGKRGETDWTAETGKFCYGSNFEVGRQCYALFWLDGQSKQIALSNLKEYPDPYNWDPTKRLKSGNRL